MGAFISTRVAHFGGVKKAEAPSTLTRLERLRNHLAVVDVASAVMSCSVEGATPERLLGDGDDIAKEDVDTQPEPARRAGRRGTRIEERTDEC